MLTTIQGKNTFYIVIVIMGFLAVLLLVNYVLLRDFSLEHAERTSGLILNSADSQLEIVFDEIEALVASLASLRAVREVDTGDIPEIFINNVLVRDDKVRAIYIGTEDGRMFEWGVGEGFTDYTPEFPEGYDPRIRPWYRLAAESGEYGLTSPYIFASVEALGITAVTPVYSEQELVGVLGLDLILHGLDNLVDSLHVPMNGRVILLNRDHQVLVNQFAPKKEAVTELEVFPYQELVRHDGSFITDEVYGDKYMVSSVENNPTGWTMLLFLPYSEIMDFSQQTIIIIIVFDLLLMFLLASLVAFITRSLVTNPLDKVITVFRRFENGDTTARIPALNGLEFNLMARLFNRLSDISAEYSQQLEEKVEQRTQAVVKLQKENVRLRIIEEKERIYANLHDSLGARLTSINISNNVAKSALERDEKEVLSEMLERVEKNTMQGIQDLKEILLAGQSEKLTVHDLHDFIERLMSHRLKLKEIKLTAQLPEVSEILDLDPEFTADLEKLIQELVSNTMKHSGASAVDIDITINSQTISFIYKDNGDGFILKDALKNGFGLQGLFSRAERMGGILKIVSKPGRFSSFNFQFRTGD